MGATSFAAVVTAGALLAGAGPAFATGGGNDTSSKLRKAVSVDGIRLHQAAFGLIAEVKGGNRLAGTPGHDLSADHVDLQARLPPAGLAPDLRVRPVRARGLKPPVLAVRGGKRYIPGIPARSPAATSAR